MLNFLQQCCIFSFILFLNEYYIIYPFLLQFPAPPFPFLTVSLNVMVSFSINIVLYMHVITYMNTTFIGLFISYWMTSQRLIPVEESFSLSAIVNCLYLFIQGCVPVGFPLSTLGYQLVLNYAGLLQAVIVLRFHGYSFSVRSVKHNLPATFLSLDWSLNLFLPHLPPCFLSIRCGQL